MDSRIPSRRNTSYSSSWARLENFLLGRTLHVHSLSPLTPPPILFDDHSHDDSLTASQLDKIAKELQNFLSVRLTNTLQTVDNRTSNDAASTATGSIRRLRKGFIRAVKASFVELPLSHQQDFQTDENSHSIPKPWGIEIEIQPPESSVNPFSNLTDRSKPQTQKAHILFLSNAKFATSTHYSILLWKAPPSATYTEDVESQTQQSRIDGQDDAMLSRMNASSTENTVSVTSRMLMAHALDFISRFFDCRVSQEAPLCSIRGLNLERMSEAILRFHRSRREENDRSSLLSSFDRFGIDLGFALPTQVLSDIAQSSSTIENGPAPHLNLISLTVPAADVKSLMTGTREGMPILPGIQQYLALHASLQLHRLTLVRAGIANIFIGVPTATTLISSTGQISGEVRLKISPIGKGQMDKRAQCSSQEIANLERERIGVVLRQLVLLSEEDDW